MASSMIHIAVASEINKKINRKKKDLFIGTIAPDIAKQIGETKEKSHFQEGNSDLPILSKFLDKYEIYLNDDFVLGYYIHLYTDYLWFKYFVPDFCSNGKIYKLDGTTILFNADNYKEYFYSDYTNLNINLIDEYDLELKMFYEEIPKFNNIIEEIPMDKINIIVDRAGIILENTKEAKPYVFDMEIIKRFIKTSSEYILSDLKERGVY